MNAILKWSLVLLIPIAALPLLGQEEPPPTRSASEAEVITRRTPTRSASEAEVITRSTPTRSASEAEVITRSTPTRSASEAEVITRSTPTRSASEAEVITRSTPTRSVSEARFTEAPGAKVPPKTVTNSIGMELVRIEPGRFIMGSPKTEIKREEGEDEHEVEISELFYMGKFEVTQAEYMAVMGKNPSRFPGDKLPVETVSWTEAKEFCDKLSKKEVSDKPLKKEKRYTLPTEAEWEYACRAGTKTPFQFGNLISTDDANYNGNKIYGDGKKGIFRRKTEEVGSFRANKWGLHDMHGNVWEWCEDWYGGDYYKNSPKKDPKGEEKGEWRVLRGGSWETAPEECRSANRAGDAPDSRENHIGFRVVLRNWPSEFAE